MTVNPCNIFSWSSSDVLDGSSIHSFWKRSSLHVYLEDSISTSEAELANAPATGVSYANQVKGLLDKAASAGNTSEVYSVYVHGIGDRESQRGLEHADDAIPGWSDGSDVYGNGGPYTENGRAASKLWGTAFLIAFKDQLDLLGYPYPQRFHYDTETTYDMFEAAKAPSAGYPGWFDAAYEDPRATTELVDGISTFKDLVDNWVIVGGGSDTSLTWDVEANYWGESNKDLRDFNSHLVLRVRDYFLYDVLLEKAQELFPGVTWSNWNHGHYNTVENPTVSRSKASADNYGDRGPYSEWAAPALYPMTNNNFQDVGSNKADWITKLGIEGQLELAGPPYDEDFALVWTTASKQLIEGVERGEGGPENLSPWITFAGQYYFSLSNFVDGVDLVTIDSVDIDKLAVGNTLTLRDSGSNILYSGDIVKLVDQENGTHKVNIANISPTDEGNFGSVALATDSVIQEKIDVSNVASESTNYNYQTRQEDILNVLTRCVELGITEYIFWQNPALMNDARWELVAQAMAYVEEGLGVLLGQIGSAAVSVAGNSIDISFNAPANGSWDLLNLQVNNSKAPVIKIGDLVLPFTNISEEDLSIDGSDPDTLFATLVLTDDVISTSQNVTVTFQEGWIYDPDNDFRSSATVNVSSGFDSNLTEDDIAIINNSAEPDFVLNSSSPVDEDTGVSVQANILLEFQAPIELGEGSIYLYRSSDDVLIDSITASSLVINPENLNLANWVTSFTLDNSEIYYILADVGSLKEPSGRNWSGISDKTVLNFTTEVVSVLAPELSFTIPYNGASRIALPITSTTGTLDLDVDYVFEFDQDVVAGAGSVHIYDSIGLVVSEAVGNLTIAGSTVTWTNPAGLVTDTDYYILADEGLVVSDFDGSDWRGIIGSTELEFRTYTSGPSVVENISKEPMWLISMFSGGNDGTGANPWGHANWWNVDPAQNPSSTDGVTGLYLYATTAADAVRNLKQQIEYGYLQGARTFFMNRPMGSDGATHVSGAAWETIDETKRTLMAAMLLSLSNGEFGEPIKLIPFIGSGIIAADDLSGWQGPLDPLDGFLLGDNSTAEREAISNTILEGWINDCGVAGFAIDHSSPENEREHFLGLASDLWTEYGVVMLGEGLPQDDDLDDNPYDFEADQNALTRMGWLGTDDYFSDNDFATRPHFNIPFDADTTRIFVWYQNGNDPEVDKEALYDHYTSLGRYVISGDPFTYGLALADYESTLELEYSLAQTISIGNSASNDPMDTTFFFNKTVSNEFFLKISEPLYEESLDNRPASVRVVDPNGETVYWSVRSNGNENNPGNRITVLGSDPVENVDKVDHTVQLPITNGIYKVVLKAFENESFDIYSTQTIGEWGIFCPTQRCTSDSFTLATGYVFVPAEAPEYSFANYGSGSVTITDSALSNIPETTAFDSSGNPIPDPNPTFGSDDVWVLTATGDWELGHTGTPFVICNSIIAANNIQSGTVKRDGIRFWSIGDSLAHERIVEVIGTLNSTDPYTVIRTFDTAETLWPTNSLKYSASTLYPQFLRTIHTALKHQVLTTGYRAGHANRFGESLSDVTTPWLKGNNFLGGIFGFLYAWNDAGNPYYNDDEMGKRAKIGMLAEARRVQGYRVAKRDADHNRSSRLGTVGLQSANHLGPALFFNDEANNISTEDANVLLPNLLDQLDRTFADSYTTTRNQDCITLSYIVMASKIWEKKYGNNNLEALCLQEARNICSTWGLKENVPLPEAVAYDGSYSGLQNFEMASAYICGNKDPKWSFIKDAVERNYQFWSHFISSSESGIGMFAHDLDSRTTKGSLHEQFTGAQYLLGDEVPLISRWTKLSDKYRRAVDDDADLSSYIQDLNLEITKDTDNSLLYNLLGGDSFNTFPLWVDSLSNIGSGGDSSMLPCEMESDSTFITEHVDFIDIQTPWYYASIPTIVVNPFYVSLAEEQYRPMRSFEDVGGNWIDAPYPMTTVSDRRGFDGEDIGGAGLSFLYSKQAQRPIITGRTISPFTTHQLVGVNSSNEKIWNLYETKEYEVSGNQVIITYDMIDTNVSVIKTMTFNDESISVHNKVTAQAGADLVSLHEYIPICSSLVIIGNDAKIDLENAITNPNATITDIGSGVSIAGSLESQASMIEFTDSSDRTALTFAKISMDVPADGEFTEMSYSISLPFTQEIPDDDEDEEYTEALAADTYREISHFYGYIKRQIDATSDSLYSGLQEIIAITDPDVKIDLLQAFESVYVSFGETSSYSALLSATRTLNQHVLRFTQRDSLNEFLSNNGIIVSSDWVVLSELVGFSIDPSNVENTVFNRDTPTGLVHDTSDINNGVENMCARITWDADINTDGFTFEIQRKLTSEPEFEAVIIGVVPDMGLTLRGQYLDASTIEGQEIKNEFFDYDGLVADTDYSYRVRSADDVGNFSAWSGWINNVRVKNFENFEIFNLFNTALPETVEMPATRSRLWLQHLLSWNGTQGEAIYNNDGWNQLINGNTWKQTYIDPLPTDVSSILNHLWRFPFGTNMYVKNDLDIAISNFSGGLNSATEWQVTGGLNPFTTFRKIGATITPPAGSGFANSSYELGNIIFSYLEMIKNLSTAGVRSDIYQAAPIRNASVYTDAALMSMMMGGVHLYTRTGNIKDTSPDKRFDESVIASNLPSSTPIQRLDELLFAAGVDVGGEPTFRRGQMQTFTDPLPRHIVHLLDRQRSFESSQGPEDDDYPSINEIVKSQGGRSGSFKVWVDSTQSEWNTLDDFESGTFAVTVDNILDVVINRLNHGAINGYDVIVGSHAAFLTAINAASQSKIDELITAATEIAELEAPGGSGFTPFPESPSPVP